MFQSLSFCAVLAVILASNVQAAHVTLLSTSDLHSHFRPDTDETSLGGLARLKTAIEKFRTVNPNTLLVDGGDWSEGQIYYTEGAGRETLKLMDALSYDAAIVGNHDWLNGPDTLLQSVQDAELKMSLLAANISTEGYSRRKEFNQRVLPYVIKQVGDVKVAFIGLVTWEFIFDRFLSPVKIQAPFDVVRELTTELKKQADAIVVISHNGQKLNEQILAKNPDVDLVVGAHDHLLLLKPTEIARTGKAPSWLIDTGKWGKYLGKVEMEITPRAAAAVSGQPSVKLVGYEALPIDARYAENTEIAKQIEALESRIVQNFGEVFHDQAAESEILIQDRSGAESLLGNLAADSYVQTTHADLSIESNGFLYSELQAGTVHSAEVFNSNPGVYSPATGKSWPVRVLPMSGITLQWLLGLLFSSDQIAALGGLSTSGVDIVYGALLGGGLSHMSPAASTSSTFNPFTFFMAPRAPKFNGALASPAFPNVASIRVGGKPLNLLQTYKVALAGGGYSTIEFINSWIPGAIPTSGLVDTGVESWRSLLEQVKRLKTLHLEDVYKSGTRIVKKSASLGLFTGDISMTPLQITPEGTWAKIQVRIRNFGLNASSASQNTVELFSNVGAFDSAVCPKIPGESLAPAKTLGAIPALSEESLEWTKVFIPKSSLKLAVAGKDLSAIVLRMTSQQEELQTPALATSRIWSH